MLDHRRSALVELLSGQLQQATLAARGYRMSKNFTAIAYLRPSDLTNLPTHLFSAAAAVSDTVESQTKRHGALVLRKDHGE